MADARTEALIIVNQMDPASQRVIAILQQSFIALVQSHGDLGMIALSLAADDLQHREGNHG
jgi:hypothetical protein